MLSSSSITKHKSHSLPQTPPHPSLHLSTFPNLSCAYYSQYVICSVLCPKTAVSSFHTATAPAPFHLLFPSILHTDARVIVLEPQADHVIQGCKFPKRLQVDSIRPQCLHCENSSCLLCPPLSFATLGPIPPIYFLSPEGARASVPMLL